MDNLRILLLVIGGLFVMGIYFREVFREGKPERKNSMPEAVDDIPDMPVDGPGQAGSETEFEQLADLCSLMTQYRNETAAPLDTGLCTKFPPDMSVREYEASMEDRDDAVNVSAAVQDELHGHAGPGVDISTPHAGTTPGSEQARQADGDSGAPDEQATAGEIPAQEPGETGNDLLVVYLVSPAPTLFNGLSLGKAADEVGMIYGHMDIFHHFGHDQLHSDQPLFSMANMYEPGSLDLSRMADLRTKGVVLFMYPPASIEARVVFELFLDTAQRMAALLGGELRNQDNRALDHAAVSVLRRQAEQLLSPTS